jgi:hypothetical protein
MCHYRSRSQALFPAANEWNKIEPGSELFLTLAPPLVRLPQTPGLLIMLLTHSIYRLENKACEHIRPYKMVWIDANSENTTVALTSEVAAGLDIGPESGITHVACQRHGVAAFSVMLDLPVDVFVRLLDRGAPSHAIRHTARVAISSNTGRRNHGPSIAYRG